MKKFIFLFIIFLLVLSKPTISYGITTTPTIAKSGPTTDPSPTPKPSNTLLNQINNLKDKIASKVAQLKLVEKRGIIGTVTETSATQITLNDMQNQTRFIDVDEITKFSSADNKDNFGISDLTKGTTISVLGLYNKESRRILARFVDQITLPEQVFGTVTNIDKTNYTVTIQTSDKTDEIVDIESYSKITSYTSDDPSPTHSGFSKVTINEKVLTIGTPNKKEKDRISATRMLLFPDFSGSAAPLDTPIPSGTKAVSPTKALTPSPSAKKISPTQIP